MKRAMLLPILLLLWGATPSEAQDLPSAGVEAGTEQDCGLTISGKVIDHDSREPLVGATIYIPELKRTTAADEYGNYHFHDLCQGSYTFNVTYVGYQPSAAVFKVTASAIKDLALHSDTHMLSAVQVTGTHLQTQAQASQTLSGQQLEETRGLSLAESLTSLAGVTTLQTGPSIAKPVIHGLHSNRVLLLNNGVRQEGQQWGTEHAPEIDPFVATEMKVIKGAAGVRYGADAIGGVVIVEPKALPDSTAGVAGELNLLGSTNNRQGAVSATLEGTVPSLSALSWRLQGTLKKAGNAKTPDYYMQNTGFNERNFSASLGYHKQNYGGEFFFSAFNTKLGILSASHIGSLTDLNYAIARGKPIGADTVQFTYDIDRPYQDVSHDLFKAKAFYNTGAAGKLEFTYGWQQNVRDEYDVHNVTSGKPAMHLDIKTQTTETVWTHQPLGKITGSVGLSTIYQSNTYQGSPFIPFYKSIAAGAFAIEKWRKERLGLEAGIRYDYKNLRIAKREDNNDVSRPEFNFHNVSGTVGAIYDAGYHLTLSANAASAWRAPGVNELFSDGVHHASAIYEVGDPNLGSEKAYNFEVSANYFGNQRLNGTISLYNNYINDYIYLAPAQPLDYVLTTRGAFLQFNYKQVDATFRGLDLSLQYNLLPSLSLESKTSVVRAKNAHTGEYLINIPADRFDNSIRWELNSAGGQKLTATYFSVGGVYTAEQTHAPSNPDEDYAAPPAGYFLLHAEAGTTLHFGKQPVEVGVTGNNLLNASYRSYLNRFRYYTDEMGRLLMFRIKVPLTFSKG